jgi:hypothetical protein
MSVCLSAWEHHKILIGVKPRNNYLRKSSDDGDGDGDEDDDD